MPDGALLLERATPWLQSNLRIAHCSSLAHTLARERAENLYDGSFPRLLQCPIQSLCLHAGKTKAFEFVPAVRSKQCFVLDLHLEQPWKMLKHSNLVKQCPQAVVALFRSTSLLHLCKDCCFQLVTGRWFHICAAVPTSVKRAHRHVTLCGNNFRAKRIELPIELALL